MILAILIVAKVVIWLIAVRIILIILTLPKKDKK